MANKKDLKGYIRYDGNGRVIPGALLLQRFKPSSGGKWHEIPAYECCNSAPVPLPLRILFSSILEVDAIVGDSSNVADWNTYFDLPTFGSPFTSVTVVGNEVQLFGGGNIVIKEVLFDQPDELGTYLLEVDDQAGCVIEIEYDAFGRDNNSGCQNLVSANFPEVTTIGDYCFGDCISLVTVNIPKLTTANGGCFGSCDSLVSLSFPNLTTVTNGSFINNCNSLTSVSLPALTTVGDFFVQSPGNSLTTISLPQLVTIGNQCFFSCQSLTNVNLPNLVTAGSSCFSYCPSLVSITLPKVEIFGGLFVCASLTSVSLPLCTNIRGGSFQSSFNLTNINLPACTNLGSGCSTNEGIFVNITGNTITLTIRASVMTCNGGLPDKNVEILQANNTVTIITT